MSQITVTVVSRNGVDGRLLAQAIEADGLRAAPSIRPENVGGTTIQYSTNNLANVTYEVVEDYDTVMGLIGASLSISITSSPSATINELNIVSQTTWDVVHSLNRVIFWRFHSSDGSSPDIVVVDDQTTATFTSAVPVTGILTWF